LRSEKRPRERALPDREDAFFLWKNPQGNF